VIPGAYVFGSEVRLVKVPSVGHISSVNGCNDQPQ
jgi:hypothetical protein